MMLRFQVVSLLDLDVSSPSFIEFEIRVKLPRTFGVDKLWFKSKRCQTFLRQHPSTSHIPGDRTTMTPGNNVGDTSLPGSIQPVEVFRGGMSIPEGVFSWLKLSTYAAPTCEKVGDIPRLAWNG